MAAQAPIGGRRSRRGGVVRSAHGPPVCLRADARFLKTTSILFCSLIHTNTSTSPPTVYPSIRICTHPTVSRLPKHTSTQPSQWRLRYVVLILPHPPRCCPPAGCPSEPR
ncbi:hypothetical protein IG631_12187 [Alternaria alternata]|nr:hypothetical protein IG631_12187 [Alternaria alternata]